MNQLIFPPYLFLFLTAGVNPLDKLSTSGSISKLQPLLEKSERHTSGCFQYIRMEFCGGGDVESFLRKTGEVSCATIRSFLFQMSFSLYAGREALALRHFDVKLLNFFLARGPEDEAALQIGFGKHLFSIPTRQHEQPAIVKLADFGTSTIGVDTLNAPITAQQVRKQRTPNCIRY